MFFIPPQQSWRTIDALHMGQAAFEVSSPQRLGGSLSFYLVFTALVLITQSARADERRHGFVVVAVDGATDAAWPLAQRVYQSAVLRPAGIDDARARVLAGEPPPALSPVEITELSELRRGVKGDDAASREVLAALVEKLDVHAIIVVSVAEHQTSARVYDSDLRAFDAARYLPDAPRFDTWHDAIRALERPYLRQPTSLVAPEVDRPKARRESRPFYDSPWFWVAVGAAAVLVGGGVILATTLQTNDTIHLTAQLP